MYMCIYIFQIIIYVYVCVDTRVIIHFVLVRAQSKGTQFWWERGMDAFFASRKHLEAAWAS